MLIAPVSSRPGSGSTGVVLENVALANVKTAVADTAGKALLAGGSRRVRSWATGPVYSAANKGKREFLAGRDVPEYGREISLLDTRAGVEGAPSRNTNGTRQATLFI